ncbi:hypothetical protein CGCVW01_v013381 [Colletotrichum viniferum]|nr:hypothetical protein CGCVW01_v013381 [Colletotrichum viniferum]
MLPCTTNTHSLSTRTKCRVPLHESCIPQPPSFSSLSSASVWPATRSTNSAASQQSQPRTKQASKPTQSGTAERANTVESQAFGMTTRRHAKPQHPSWATSREDITTRSSRAPRAAPISPPAATGSPLEGKNRLRCCEMCIWKGL